MSICRSVDLPWVERLELSIRYQIVYQKPPTESQKNKILAALYDRMTQTQYSEPLKSFDLGIIPEKWFEVNVMGQGRNALENVNQKLGNFVTPANK